jgi:hypothetical protein
MMRQQGLRALVAGVLLLATAGAGEAATRQMCSSSGDHCRVGKASAPAPRIACQLRKIGGSWVIFPPGCH